MNISSPVTDPVTQPAPAILAAANLLLPHLERGQRVNAAILRDAMETAFGASDASGAWDWKLAYEACEVATVLFLRKYGKALFRKADSPASRLGPLAKIAGLLPTQTRRSEESQSFQQFSTPLPLGLAALAAAAITPDDVVLEPSAGTGLMAILAQSVSGSLILNELAGARADLLSSLFPASPVTRFDAARIGDDIDLIDFDRIEPHNLNRILNATRADAVERRLKVEMFGSAVASYRGEGVAMAIPASITSRAAVLPASQADVLSCCVDTLEARRMSDGGDAISRCVRGAGCRLALPVAGWRPVRVGGPAWRGAMFLADGVATVVAVVRTEPSHVRNQPTAQGLFGGRHKFASFVRSLP